MASKSKRARMAPQRNFLKTFMYWATAVFLVKVVIILNIPITNLDIGGNKLIPFGRIWLGADGENYIKAYDFLSQEGLFSKEGILNYWPAGYPITIFILALFNKNLVFILLSIFQSIIFSYAVYFFTKQLAKTRLKKYSYLVFVLIILNPTLSLSSLTVGYESLTASGFLITCAVVIKDIVEKNDHKFIKYLLLNSAILGFLIFLQPRLIISAICINLFWIANRRGLKIIAVPLLIMSLFIMLFFPATLIYRNNKATGIKDVSLNLGITMNIGVGKNATGGYMRDGFGVPCSLNGSDSQKDKQRINCVLNWYKDNPTQTVRLFINKSIYFWSPWFNNGFYNETITGTNLRNPWLKINPVSKLTKSPDGIKFLKSWFGDLVSWLWVLGGLTLLLYGYWVLWRQNSLERFMGNITMAIILTNWLVSLISIGDHRFRMPIMGMSLFLQAVGLKTLFNRGKVLMVDGPALR